MQPRMNVKSLERKSSLSLLTLSWKLNKLRKKIEEKLIKPLFIEKSIIYKKKRNAHEFSIKKPTCISLELLSKRIGWTYHS